MLASTLAAPPDDIYALAASLRWPEGEVRCPHCGESRVSQPSADPLRWRCRQCQRRFTVTTGTRLHASKLALTDWWNAAHSDDDSTAGVMGLLSTSRVTARRVSRILRASAMPPGERRFAALLVSSDSSQGVAQQEPWMNWTEAQRRVFTAVRSHHLKGAGTNEIAHTANVSIRHTRRCLRRLAAGGFVKHNETLTTWGYDCIPIRVWQLDLTEQTISAMIQLPYQALPPLSELPTRVPPEFWSVFWSGFSAGELRLPEDGLLVAETMLSVRNPWARLWALHYAPLEALRELRTMRGYTSGDVAQEIDLAVERRSRA